MRRITSLVAAACLTALAGAATTTPAPSAIEIVADAPAVKAKIANAASMLMPSSKIAVHS